MRMPTLLPFGEGCMGGEAIDTPARSAGVVGTARRKGGSGNRGRPVEGEGSGLNVAQGGGPAGVGQGRRSVHAEHDFVMTKPGNAGGAKDPDFWCAFEAGEVKVIGDEPGNT
jgi:hypothetical protein